MNQALYRQAAALMGGKESEPSYVGCRRIAILGTGLGNQRQLLIDILSASVFIPCPSVAYSVRILRGALLLLIWLPWLTGCSGPALLGNHAFMPLGSDGVT